MRHTPVLLQQVIEALNIKKGGLYIDATVGEAGHLKEIFKHGGKVLGIDQDINQIEKLQTDFDENVKLVNGNFANIETIARKNNFFPVDGILFDLGLSMGQIENSGKGFSYKNLNEPLDMRLTEENEQTAADLVNGLNEVELYELLAKYSEDVNSKKIAKAIASKKRNIKTVGNLIAIIDSTGAKNQKVYSRIFQALRIAVNHEMENLKKGLLAALKIAKNEARIVVLTFQSLEDRVVKRFILENNLKVYKTKVRKSEKMNFERSANLRVFSKI